MSKRTTRVPSAKEKTWQIVQQVFCLVFVVALETTTKYLFPATLRTFVFVAVVITPIASVSAAAEDAHQVPAPPLPTGVLRLASAMLVPTTMKMTTSPRLATPNQMPELVMLMMV
jgi:hypothetical protein